MISIWSAVFLQILYRQLFLYDVIHWSASTPYFKGFPICPSLCMWSAVFLYILYGQQFPYYVIKCRYMDRVTIFHTHYSLWSAFSDTLLYIYGQQFLNILYRQPVPFKTVMNRWNESRKSHSLIINLCGQRFSIPFFIDLVSSFFIILYRQLKTWYMD